MFEFLTAFEWPFMLRSTHDTIVDRNVDNFHLILDGQARQIIALKRYRNELLSVISRQNLHINAVNEQLQALAMKPVARRKRTRK